MPTNKSFRDGATVWKVLRTAIPVTGDADDWVGDVSDGVPDHEGAGDICRSIPYHAPASLAKNTAIEFMVIPYTVATGLVVDRSAETFSYEPVFVHDVTTANRPKDSALRGQTGGSATHFCTDHETVALAEFCEHHRIDCDGADLFTIRIHTVSGTPTGADAYEIWYRAVVE